MPKKKKKTKKKVIAVAASKLETKTIPKSKRKKKKKNSKAGPKGERGMSSTDKARRIRVNPAWQRRPRPWEPGGVEIYRLSITGDEFVSRCCMLWAHGVSNKGISYSLGVNFRDFSHWITELDRPWLFTVDLWGEEQRVKCTFGDLCHRMKETFEPIYITKLKQIITDAEEQGDMKTASSNLRWLMEKTMPRKYGKHETLNIHNIPIAIKTAGDEDDPEGQLNIEDI